MSELATASGSARAWTVTQCLVFTQVTRIHSAWALASEHTSCSQAAADPRIAIVIAIAIGIGIGKRIVPRPRRAAPYELRMFIFYLDFCLPLL